jgi:hypothetical protein
MTGNTRPAQSRPNSAPPYYLGRPATWWISVTAAGRRRGPDGDRRQPVGNVHTFQGTRD